jgi:hypothetical protein
VTQSAPRDTAVFEVRDALAQPGCAVRRLALRSVRRFLQSVAYEQVNYPGLRADMRAALGFCNQHAYRWLREAHSPIFTAALYLGVRVHVYKLTTKRARLSRSL